MSGRRIENAKETLILYLKSIPKGSYFNIISFGSEFELLYKEDSQKYENNEEIQKIIDLVKKFEADMGGTEIYEPLNYVFSNLKKKEYPR